MKLSTEALTWPRLWRSHLALPAEHGAWAMWLGPLAVGLGAAGVVRPAHGWLIGAMLFLFLARQPLLIAVKAVAGRRARADLAPAILWVSAYCLGGALFCVPLLLGGYGDLARLLPIGALVLAWHLALVAKRAERQMMIELVGAGALALAAPAAYRVGAGAFDATAAWLWVLCGLQSAAAIVYVYLRLEQRRLSHVPEAPERWRMARWALGCQAFNFLAVLGLAVYGATPPLAPMAFAAMLIQAVWGAARPAVGARPQAIGVAQVGATVVFALLLIAAYRWPG